MQTKPTPDADKPTPDADKAHARNAFVKAIKQPNLHHANPRTPAVAESPPSDLCHRSPLVPGLLDKIFFLLEIYIQISIARPGKYQGNYKDYKLQTDQRTQIKVSQLKKVLYLPSTFSSSPSRSPHERNQLFDRKASNSLGQTRRRRKTVEKVQRI
jgi:hypothetical protein